ncbi:MAG: winged helix-turn-helix domain-containing protein [Thermoanaerobaculia bacterium]
MSSGPRISFGDFSFDAESGELRRGGEAIALQILPGRVLAALVARPGELVTRAELADALWGAGTHVDAEAGLHTAVAKLREALHDSAESPRFVQTVPRRGYRFIARIGSDLPVPGADPVRPDPVAALVQSPTWRRKILLVAVVVFLAVLAAGYFGTGRRTRVAVILFDNETGRTEWTPVAQSLTDSTVERLAANPQVEVIGNATELSTARPFRDLAAIAKHLSAQYVVIGQIQAADGGVRLMNHLVRGSDLVHLWAEPRALPASAGEVEESRIADEVAAHILRSIAPARPAKNEL